MGLERSEQKVAIVTGATDGVGFEVAKALVCKGWKVIAHGRNTQKAIKTAVELNAAAGIARQGGIAEEATADLASLRAIKSFADKFKARNVPLDLLVNNAGIALCPDGTTEDGFEITVGTNHFGPFYLTQALLPSLKANGGSRIVWVSSSSEPTNIIDFDDLEGVNQHSSFKQYGRSKLMNQMTCRELGKRLNSHGVYNVAAWPGAAKTGIFRTHKMSLLKPFGVILNILERLFGMSARNGAKPLVYACLTPQRELEEQGASGEVMFGPYHARPFPAIFGTGYPAIQFQGWNWSDTLNCLADKPENPLVYDDEACRRLYEGTIAVLQSKLGVKDLEQ